MSISFEKIVHDENIAQKFYASMANSVTISDPELFIAYCIEKESVRLRYLTFKSENYLKDTKQPDDAAIKKFYDEATKDKENILHRDFLMAPMTMSVEALGFKDEKQFTTPKATDEDLKKYYDQWKGHWWKESTTPPKEQPKPGEKPPEEKFKLLIRNIRKKQREKLDLRRVAADVPSGEEGARGRVSSSGDSDRRRE